MVVMCSTVLTFMVTANMMAETLSKHSATGHPKFLCQKLYQRHCQHVCWRFCELKSAARHVVVKARAESAHIDYIISHCLQVAASWRKLLYTLKVHMAGLIMRSLSISGKACACALLDGVYSAPKASVAKGTAVCSNIHSYR